MKKIMIFVFGGVLIFLDQIVKYSIISTLAVGDSIQLIPKFLKLFHVQNTGAAFSIFENSTWLLTLVSAFAAILLIYVVIKEKKITKMTIAIYSLLFGGIIGNLIDRIRFGYVVDYVSILKFPIFNIADCCIVIGVLLMLIVIIRGELNETVNRK